MDGITGITIVRGQHYLNQMIRGQHYPKSEDSIFGNNANLWNNNKRQTTTIRYNSYKVESSEMVKNKQKKTFTTTSKLKNLPVSRSVESEDPSSDFRSTHSNICRIADFDILKYVISDKNCTNESHIAIFSIKSQQSVTLDECYCNCLFWSQFLIIPWEDRPELSFSRKFDWFSLYLTVYVIISFAAQLDATYSAMTEIKICPSFFYFIILP